jgi:heme/copper-type cytochrome/quinol oxidase subunit 2
MIGVFYYLLKFCIQYRHRGPGTKGHFSHGNKRLELIWTAIPAVILLALALWTKGSWDNYRYSPTANDPNRAQILIVGQQFAWNVVYAGPDKKLGRYLMFPKVTDVKWPDAPKRDKEGRAVLDEKGHPVLESPNSLAAQTGVPGPAYYDLAKAKDLLDDYVRTVNPLGKDFSDPDGRDDIWDGNTGQLFIPRGRPVDIHLATKDVLHDVFIPEFRVKLDAVPGMRGHIYFTATKSSEGYYGAESRREYPLDELAKLIGPLDADYRVVVPAAQAERFAITEVTPGGKVRRRVQGKVVEVDDPDNPPKKTVRPIIKDRESLTHTAIEQLRALGHTSVTAYRAKTWEIVCEELCGNGHTGMRAKVEVLEPDGYARRFETPFVPAGTTPATQPSTPPATQPVAPVAAAGG